MQEISSFLVNHLFLSTLWAAIAAMLLVNLLRSALSGIAALSPQETTARINREEAVLVDLRSKVEFGKGHIAGSLNLPFEQFVKEGAAELEKHKAKPIILACATGMQSGAAAMQLKKAGFADVSKLAGGVPAWAGANLPLVKK
ncbi:MAG: rhodanese-like domain-containing protein [Gammaproteobacteria bacterium]|nr:rhodanese-like domain-containing protein [Gammaproteobacteria bacterium]